MWVDRPLGLNDSGPRCPGANRPPDRLSFRHLTVEVVDEDHPAATEAAHG